jgi:tRNA (adenine22-N1)-methyltransferase
MQHLSKRLRAVADYVTEGKRVVDVGTDHAYIPIFLLQEGRCEAALAADIGKGPLERARENIAENGLSERIETILSDGLKKIDTDFECLILAGMGGKLIREILSENPEKTASFEELILEPQSELEALRLYLRENGFWIDRENMVLEDGKYYPILHVIQRPVSEIRESLPKEKELLSLYDRYGYHLLKEGHPVLLSFLQKEEREKEKVLFHLENLAEKGLSVEKRKEELQKELFLNRRAQKLICGRKEGKSYDL